KAPRSRPSSARAPARSGASARRRRQALRPIWPADPALVSAELLSGGAAVNRESAGEGRGRAGKRDISSAGEDLVPAAGLVPLGDRRGLKHLLDDLPPPDAGVVRAEGDLPHLRRVRDDAHLRAAEVVVEEVLEPHPAHEEDAPVEAPLV